MPRIAGMKEDAMAATICADGFYQTGPKEWEEWHAGIRMYGIHFYYIRFYANGDWLRCYRDHAFDFWGFTETVMPELFALAKRDMAPKIGDYDPLCTAGTYTITDDIVTLRFMPRGIPGRLLETHFEIEEDRLVRSAGVFLFSPPSHEATT
jgi:hypothetical protein